MDPIDTFFEKEEVMKEKKGKAVMDTNEKSNVDETQDLGRALFNRRSFIAGTIAAATAMTATAASLPAFGSSIIGEAEATGGDIAPGDVAALGTGPNIADSDIAEVIDCDVVVVGCGISGLAATRSCAEQNLKTFCVEKKLAPAIHGFDAAINNSSLAMDMGIYNDPTEVLKSYQRRTCGRANYRILSHWTHGSGKAFDWYLEPKRDDAEFIERINVWCTPAWDEHNPENDIEPYFLGTCNFQEDPSNPIGSPHWIALGNANMEAAIAAGAEFLFTHAVIKLDTDATGKVTGCFVKDLDGVIKKYVTSKGVILATGGAAQFGAGGELIHKVFAPQCYKNWMLVNGEEPRWEQEFEILPDPRSSISGTTGDGQLMAVWVGAQMDAYADTSMGSSESAIGGTCTLSVDQAGERFWNEDMGIWVKHDTVFNLPGRVCYDIIDVNWRDMLKAQAWGHRNFYYTDRDVSVGWSGFDYVDAIHGDLLNGVGVVDGDNLSTVYHGKFYGADTLEELADMIGVPQETFLKTVARYNKYCDQGFDEQFGVDPLKLMPIKEAPFFACVGSAGAVMGAYAGLVTNGQFQVLHREKGVPIEGLWAVGNCGGQKFAPMYNALMGGMNHGGGLTYGYYCGLYVAGKEVDLGF